MTAVSIFLPNNTANSANILNFGIDCEVEPKRIEVADAAAAAADELSDEERLQREEDCLLPNISSRNTAVLDLALTIKTAADEFYLNGNIDAAKERYLVASSFLEEINSGKSVLGEPIDRSSEFDLLNADIGYRLTLLQAGADFWGTGYLNHPANPVKLLLELQSDFEDFSQVVNEINEFQSISKEGAIQQATIRALYNEASSEAQAELWKVEQSSSLVRSADDTKDYLFQQLVDNARRQQEIKTELEAVWAEIDKLGDQVSDIAANAAASAVGLPPGVGSVISSGGDLEENLLEIGLSLAGDGALASSLVASSSELSELYEAAAAAQEIASEINDNKKLVMAVYDGFRSGFNEQNLIQMVAVGGEILDELEVVDGGIEDLAAIMSEVENFVDNGKIDLETVLDIAVLDESFEEIIHTHISDLVGEDFSEFARKITQDVDRHLSTFEALKVMTQNSRALPSDLQAMVVGTLLTYPELSQPINYLNDVDVPFTEGEINNFLPELKNEIEQTLGVEVLNSSPDALSAALLQAVKSESLKLNIEFDVGGEARVAVTLGTQTFDLSSSFTKDVFDANAMIQSELQSDLSQIEELLGEGSFDAIVRRELNDFVASIEAPDAAKMTKEFLSRGLLAREELIDLIATEAGVINKEARSLLIADLAQLDGDILKPLAKLIVAKEIAPGVRTESIAPLPTSFGALSPEILPVARVGEAQPTPAEEQVATMLIANTIPGGAAVAAALQVSKALGQMDLAIQKGNELYNEDKALSKAQVHLADMISSNRDARNVAEFEQTIAQVRGRGAAASSNAYLQAIVQSSEQMSDAQAQARMRVPLAIFHAEQMRRTFDELNHALALWVGSAGSPRGTIERLVREDPQYMRLALDSDIQLYRWLVRDGEGDRTDLRSLVNHWRQIVAITDDVCRRVGCSSDAAVVGPVKQTGPISVRSLVGDSQWRRFLNWRNSEESEPFAFTVLFTPSAGLIDPEFQLVRAVDVGVGIRFATNDEIKPLNRSSLTHPGVAYVSEHEGEFFKEFYPFVKKHDLTWNAAFDTDELRMRWSRNSDLSQRDFEGYGVFTIWELSVGRSDVHTKPEDIYINFAYQYQTSDEFDPFSRRTDISEIMDIDALRLSTSELQQGFTPRDVELVASVGGICAKVRTISERLNEESFRDDLVAAEAAGLGEDFQLSFHCEGI